MQPLFYNDNHVLLSSLQFCSCLWTDWDPWSDKILRQNGGWRSFILIPSFCRWSYRLKSFRNLFHRLLDSQILKPMDKWLFLTNPLLTIHTFLTVHLSNFCLYHSSKIVLSQQGKKFSPEFISVMINAVKPPLLKRCLLFYSPACLLHRNLVLWGKGVLSWNVKCSLLSCLSFQLIYFPGLSNLHH